MDTIPPHLAPHWPAEFWSFHSPYCRTRHLERSGVLRVERADMLPRGSGEVYARTGYPYSQTDIDLLRADTEGSLGFTRVVARRTGG